ncbi:MAG TPA: MFS transporter, partial [Candidatus Binatia bacterium]|nr:MFS transporter [Candidatus Binatia bacterium]
MRHRPIAGLVLAVATGSTAYIAAFTAAALAAREITGRPEFSGLPSAVGVAATAAAIGLLSVVMARRGRRPGLLVGYLTAVAGACAAVAAYGLASLPLLLAASALVGFGQAAMQLSRYAAADLVEPEGRPLAVGAVVWGSTAGAVIGPNLLGPAGSWAEGLGRSALEGGFAVVVVGFVASLLVTLVAGPAKAIADAAPSVAPGASRAHADPIEDPLPEGPDPTATLRGGALARLLAPTAVRVAVIGLLAAQGIMVHVMTMTPVHVRDGGGSLAAVGGIISAHTLGMFALSPLSGRLVARFGPLAVTRLGFGLLAVAGVAAAAAPHDGLVVLGLGLFLLGFGWNLVFVAASSILAADADS